MSTLRNHALPLILAMLSGLAGLILVVSFDPFLRIGAGVFQIVFLPGYAFLNVLFSQPTSLNPLWRWSFVVPSSITLVGLTLLVINYFFVYEYAAMIVCITVLNFVLLVAGLMRSPRPIGTTTRPLWPELRFHLSSNQVMLALAGLFFIGSVVFALALPKKIQHYTEFYVLGADNQLLDTTQVSNGGQLNLRLGIVNHEGSAGTYTLAVQSNSQSIYESSPILIEEGERYEGIVGLQIPRDATSQPLIFYLALEGKPYPYRDLSLRLGSSSSALLGNLAEELIR
jgi:uncharacterized membrane protein